MDTRPLPLDVDAQFSYSASTGERVAVFPVSDFWRWGFSNIQENVIRGILAEYLVGRAVGASLQARQSWDEADIVTPERVKIEVKSSAFIQAWDSDSGALPKIVFANLKTKLWKPGVGYAKEPDYHADLYVFCIQIARSREAFDPLDLDQWEFWVLSRRQVASGKSRSLSYARLSALGGLPVRYAQLKDRVAQVSAEVHAA